MKNLQTKLGQTVEVKIDSKTQMATVNGKKLAFVRDNQIKVLNDMILTDASLNLVKEEMSKQFVKKVESTKKRK